MMRKSTWFTLVMVFVLLPSTLLAQEMMHGKWWLNKTLTEELQLTDTERNILEEKYTDSRRRMIDLKSEVEKQRLELDILLDRQGIDREQIIEQYDKLEAARAKLSKERFGLLIDMREILGTERYQALKELHRDRMRSRMDKRSSGRRSSFRGRY